MDIPICINLDNTLIATDLFYECLVSMLSINPLLVFCIPFWVISGGLPNLKQKAYEHSKIDLKILPYRKRILDFLKTQKEENNRQVVLISMNYAPIAKQIAASLGIFDGAITSDSMNLNSFKKRDLLLDIYGKHGFDYIGSSSLDLPVFEVARLIYLVDPAHSLLAQANKTANIEAVFRGKKDKILIFFKEIRIQRWCENMLLFMALLFAPADINVIFQLLPKLFIAFLSFGFINSSAFILNDLIDLSSDRKNQKKRTKPIASGLMPIKSGLIIVPIFFFIGIMFSLINLSPQFNILLCIYIATILLSSLILKHIRIFNAVVSASLSTLIIFSSFVIAKIFPPIWLLISAEVLFLSLALFKSKKQIN